MSSPPSETELKQTLRDYEVSEFKRLSDATQRLVEHVSDRTLDTVMLLKLTVINDLTQQLTDMIDDFLGVSSDLTDNQQLDEIVSIEQKHTERSKKRLTDTYLPSIIAFDLLESIQVKNKTGSI